MRIRALFKKKKKQINRKAENSAEDYFRFWIGKIMEGQKENLNLSAIFYIYIM